MRLSIFTVSILWLGCTPEVSVIENEAEGDEPGECSDGADNDEDGDFDCDDTDCIGAPDCDEGGNDSGGGGGSSNDSGSSNNTPPSAPGVATAPSCADSDEDVTCVLSTASTDPDDDPVSYDYAWSADSGASATGITLSSGQTTGGEEWTCTVTPSDGFVDGSPGSASLPVYGPCQGRESTSFSSGLGSGWSSLGGSVSAGSGYVELVRTREEWAAAQWSDDDAVEGGLTLEATLSVHSDQGVVGACITNGDTSTGISIPGIGDLYGRGYCLLLSTETQNGSEQGAFLMVGDVTGNLTILAEKRFAPSHGQQYTLALDRTCAGELTLWVDGEDVGTGSNTDAMSFKQLLLVGGEDDYTADFPGGRVHSLTYEGCQ
jgi:hypothetical protein